MRTLFHNTILLNIVYINHNLTEHISMHFHIYWCSLNNASLLTFSAFSGHYCLFHLGGIFGKSKCEIHNTLCISWCIWCICYPVFVNCVLCVHVYVYVSKFVYVNWCSHLSAGGLGGVPGSLFPFHSHPLVYASWYHGTCLDAVRITHFHLVCFALLPSAPCRPASLGHPCMAPPPWAHPATSPA